MEETIVSSLIREINEVYDLSLDEKPDLDRQLDPAPFHDTGRTVIIGSSHMKRIASHMAAEASLVDFSVPGRIANSESIESVASDLTTLKITDRDSVIIDVLSNSTYMGTDDNSIPSRPV